MRISCCRSLSILLLFGLLTGAQIGRAATPDPAKPPSSYPQIVRLSYIEGDVRVSRGKLADKVDVKEGEAATGWEQAVTNLPIESGYSVVTGTGRAEIELEDASTVYLAANSVLSFGELSTTSGVPYTEMELLAGTATLDVHTMVQGESLHMITPTDDVTMRYPQKAYLRVDSYLDATAITPQQDLTFRLPGMTPARSQVAGQTMAFSHGRRVFVPKVADPVASAAWDEWVAERVATRNEAISAAMKQAGLSAPIPGLAEMNGQGRFFACVPYGICWEPTNGWTGHAVEATLVKPPAGAAPTQPAAPTAAEAAKTYGEDLPQSALASIPARTAAKPSVVDAYLASHPGATLRTEDYTFPCSATAERDLIGFDPATGKDTVIASDFELNDLFLTQGYRSFVGYPGRMLSPFRVYDAFNNLYPWDWAVCHAGTWIRWEHRYVWVTGEKRHHHPPVRWVKKEHLIGFVPVHPRDVAGKPPINLKEGIFHLTGKSGVKVEHASLDAGGPVKLLDEAPKEFRKPEVEPLKSVDTPHAVAHYAFNNMLATKNVNAAKGAALAGGAPAKGYAAASPGVVRTATARDEGAPINFDRKSQSFTVARQVNENGRPTTVSEPLGGRGGGYQPAGNSNSSMARGTNPGGGYSNGGAATSSARSYTPPSSNSGSSNGGSYSRPSAPTYSPPASSYSPPAPSYSAPSAPSGGSSAGSSGGAQHK